MRLASRLPLVVAQERFDTRLSAHLNASTHDPATTQPALRPKDFHTDTRLLHSGLRMKTNAVRLLDEAQIAYELREYEVDPDDLSAECVAKKIGMPAEQVFKTLVVRGDVNGVMFAIVPGDSELNLKALAKVSGDRKIEMVPLKEVQLLTGYIRGGVTALASKKDYPVYLDETAILFDQISISAGMRGMQIVLHPDDYVRITRATTGEIAAPK